MPRKKAWPKVPAAAVDPWACWLGDVRAGVLDEERRHCQADPTTMSAPTQTTVRRDCDGERSGREGEGDAEIARRLVQAEREPASTRADQIDLHHDRHRPGKPWLTPRKTFAATT